MNFTLSGPASGFKPRTCHSPTVSCKTSMKTHQSLILLLLTIHLCSCEQSFGQNTVWQNQGEPVIGLEQYILNIETQIDRKNLPDSARGRVFIQVLVKPDSTISVFKVIHSECEMCNKEALRLVVGEKSKWIPYSYDGVQKEGWKIFPINF